MNADTIDKIAKQLEACAHGEADVADVVHGLNLIDRSELNVLAERAIHFLNHYAADADIREKNKEYDIFQKEKLLKYAELLRK